MSFVQLRQVGGGKHLVNVNVMEDFGRFTLLGTNTSYIPFLGSLEDDDFPAFPR